MKRISKSQFFAVAFTFVLIIVVYAFSTSAQTMDQRPGPPTPTRDTSVYPFDFSDRYYLNHGIDPSSIIGRRTGFDGLSVFDKSSNPNHSAVRITATIPAYSRSGEPVFWYPIGDLTINGFTDDKIGYQARQMGMQFPIYVFPDPDVYRDDIFTNTRQASLIDDSWSIYSAKTLNPLGIRQIILVNYTEKAFGKEGLEMMNFFGKKNGFATNGTPLIKSLEDIAVLEKYELITRDSLVSGEILPPRGQFAMSPAILSLKSAIAKDAFLLMPTKDGQMSESEGIFVSLFDCLQTGGDGCG